MPLTAAKLQVEFAAAGVAATEQAIDRVSGKVQDTAGASQAAGGALLAVGGAGLAAFGKGLQLTTDFESKMSGLAAVTGVTGTQLQALDDLALQIGKDTSFSASEASDALAELAKAGVSVQDILGGAGEGATALAAAAGVAVPEAATLMSNALNIFRLGGDQATHVADVFAAAANKSAADVSELGYAMQASGTVAAQFGVGLEDTVGTLALFHDYGLRGSDAGTSFKTMMLSLLDPTKKQKEMINQLGLSFYDAQGQFIGVAGLAGELQSKLGGLTDEERQTALAVLFGSDAIRAASVLYQAGAAGVQDYADSVNDTGAAADMAGKRLDNLAGDLEAAQGSVETLAITFLRFTQGPLRRLVQGGTAVLNWLIDLPAGVQQTIAILGVLGSAVAAAAGAWALFGDKVVLAVRGMLMLTPPLAILAAALGAFYLAWTNNWGGIRDVVADVVGAVQPTLQRFADAFGRIDDVFGRVMGRTINPFRAGMRGLITFLNRTLGPDNPLSAFLGSVMRLGTRAGRFIQTTILPAVARLRDLVMSGWETGGLMGALGGLAGGLGDLAGTAISGLIAGFTERWPALQGWITSTALPMLLVTLQGAVEGFKTTANGWVLSAIAAVTAAWPGISEWLTTTGLPGIVATMTRGGAELLGAYYGALWDHKEDVFRFFTDVLLPGIGLAMAGASTLLIAAGVGLLDGLRHGAQDVWNNQLGPWLQGRAPEIQGLFATASTWLVTHGQAAIDGFRHGAQDYWNNTAYPWLQGRSDDIMGLFNTASTWLQGAGQQTIDGLRHGAQDYWNNTAWPWLTGLPGQIIGIFAGAGGWLKDAGANMVGGFKAGAEGAWGGVTGWVGEKVGALPAVANAAQDAGSPARKWFPVGENAIDGIIVGAENRRGALEDTFGGIMGRLPRTSAGALGAIDMGYGSDPRAVVGALKNYMGDHTPEALVDVALSLERMMDSGRVNLDLVRDAILRLKAYGGDNTPAEIVAQARSLEQIFLGGASLTTTGTAGGRTGNPDWRTFLGGLAPWQRQAIRGTREEYGGHLTAQRRRELMAGDQSLFSRWGAPGSDPSRWSPELGRERGSAAQQTNTFQITIHDAQDPRAVAQQVADQVISALGRQQAGMGI